MKTKIASILDRFIYEKLEAYIEPTRKGTPKGDPIGFPNAKYAATLFSMKRMSVKDTAAQLNISYGLLRKWRTEEQFNDLAIRHCIEYADLVKRHLQARAEKLLLLLSTYLDKPLDEVVNTPPPDLNFNEFVDIKFYSNLLIEKIIKSTLDYWRQLANGDVIITKNTAALLPLTHLLHNEYVKFYDLLAIPVSKQKELKGKVAELKNAEKQQRDKWFDEIRQLLAEKNPGEDNLKQAIARTYRIQGKATYFEMDINMHFRR